MVNSQCRPSIIWGLRAAVRLWALVVAVWLIGLVLIMPASVVVNGAAADAFARVPDDFQLPDGDGAILLSGIIGEVGDTVIGELALVLALSWMWTVLWHAGVARLMIWSPEGPFTLSRVVGLGLGAWWRYCRLSLVAVGVLIGLLVLVWFPLGLGIKAAYQAMAEDRVVLLIAVGIVLSPVVKFLVWGATLRGAWILARPDARSSVMAWLKGVAGVFRQPFASFSTLLVLGFAQVAVGFVPLVAPLYFPFLRVGFASLATTAVATLASSFFVVALFAAFAPVSGMVLRPEDDDSK